MRIPTVATIVVKVQFSSVIASILSLQLTIAKFRAYLLQSWWQREAEPLQMFVCSCTGQPSPCNAVS